MSEYPQVKRAKRLEPVRQIAAAAERDCAARVESAQARLVKAQNSLAELQRYLQEYQRAFQNRAATGMGVGIMRDYQTFSARLHEVAKQQQLTVEQCQAEFEQERSRWRAAATRKLAVSGVIARAGAEEHRVAERRAQNETDERAQRIGGAR